MIRRGGSPWIEAAGVAAGLVAVAVAVWLLPASVHIVSWPADGPSRVALFASRARLIWLVAAALALSAGFVIWSGAGERRRRLAAVLAPWSLLWLWAVPYLPWLPDRAPLLLVFAGPARWVVPGLALLGIAPLRSRLGAALAALPARVGRRAVFAASLVVYLALGLHSASTTGPGGDEPHYLIIAHSLLADGDLQIENNHQRGDYRRFFGGTLRPDYMRRGQNGAIYSIHAPGLPLLLVPAYAAAGFRGTVVLIGLLAALAALAIFDVAREVGGAAAGLITWAAVCLTVPFVPHSWLVFPEMPAALVVAWAVSWVWAAGAFGMRPADAPPRAAVWAWRGLALAALPWLHTKFAVFTAMFALALLIPLRRHRRAAGALLVPIAISTTAWLLSFYVIYGTINPEAPYGDYTRLYVLARNIPRGLLGILFDQKFGLLFYSPTYLFAAAGAWLMLRRPDLRYAGAVLLLVAGVFVGATTRLYMWWGGSSAPARFLVPILPCLAPMIAVAVAAARGAAARAALGVWLSISLAVAIAGAGWPERLYFYSDSRGYGRLLEAVQAAAPLAMSFPTFTYENWTRPLLELGAWAVAGAAGLGVMAFAGRRGAARTGVWLATLGTVTFLFTASVVANRAGADLRRDTSRRGALDLMWQYDGARLRAFEYHGLRKIDASRLYELSAVAFDAYPVVPFALPAGRYEARVWFSGARPREGEIDVSSSIHRAVFGRVGGTLGNPAVVPFDLPVGVTRLTVNVSDRAGATAVSRVEILPKEVVPRSARATARPVAIESIAGRPGAYLVYLDRYTFPEGGVFWTRATEAGALLVMPGGAATAIVTLHTGPVGGDVIMTIDGEASRVAVPPNETVVIERPLRGDARAVPVTVQSSTMFRPADVDPAASDVRLLGCQVRIELR